MSSPPPSRSAIADQPPAGSELPLSGDFRIALLHLPREHRDRFEALFAIDCALAAVAARASDPALGKIKLAWWREQLEMLDRARPPDEPRLSAAADRLLTIGITGHELAALEEGWSTLLDAQPDPALVAARGRRLFALGARILGVAAGAEVEAAGAFHALASVARGRPALAAAARAQAASLRGHRFERKLRGLTLLARIAARDADEPDDRQRAIDALRHRWSGLAVPKD